MSDIHTEIIVEPTPEPEKKESSDALARRTLCVNPEDTAAFDRLVDMHRYMRPAWSKTEKAFIRKFILPCGALPDKYGNYYHAVGEIPLMWSSHVDTVHDHKGLQIIGYDKMEIGRAAENKVKSNCLGADDTAGVWLMLEMIRMKVPGLYVFHRAEEGGRKGSQYIAKTHGELLKKFKYCIALDRRDTDSVITYQSALRSCSDAFAKSLIDQLDMDYKLDTTGSFTDSHSYVDLIPECTNISVGYTGAHTPQERLDLAHIFKLRDALVKMDWTKLVCEREAGTVERKTYSYTSYNGGRTYSGTDYDEEWGLGSDYDWVQNTKGTWVRREAMGAVYDARRARFNGSNTLPVVVNGKHNGETSPLGEFAKMYPHPPGSGTSSSIDIATDKLREKEAEKAASTPLGDDEEFDENVDLKAYARVVKRNSLAIAEILDHMGVKLSDLQNEIMEMYGVVNC